MPEVKILSITRIGAADRERIEAVDPAIRFTDAGGWFDGEYRETWPEYAVSRYLPREQHRAGHARGTRPAARRSRNDPRRLAVPARSARPAPSG